jgi:hypothetical protein
VKVLVSLPMTMTAQETDGYTGPVLGVFRVKGTGWIDLQESQGNYTVPMRDETYDWCMEHLPGFADFKLGAKDPALLFRNNLWHIKLRVYGGQLVKIAQRTNRNTGQLIGFGSDDPGMGAVNLPFVSYARTPWFIHKPRYFERYFPLIQPAQNTTVPNAAWISMDLLEAP